jgi:hypothetical protein
MPSPNRMESEGHKGPLLHMCYDGNYYKDLWKTTTLHKEHFCEGGCSDPQEPQV